jgi:hypothetical protein
MKPGGAAPVGSGFASNRRAVCVIDALTISVPSHGSRVRAGAGTRSAPSRNFIRVPSAASQKLGQLTYPPAPPGAADIRLIASS